MSAVNVPRASRRAVAGEPLAAGMRYDYADAFEVRVREPDLRSAEEVVRAGLEGAPRGLRAVVLFAHRVVLRLRLAPLRSRGHVLGWRVVTSEPDLVRLEAAGPLIRGVLVARKADPTSASLTTFVVYNSRAARAVWMVTGPLHRRVAPFLLQRACRDATG